MIAGSTRNCGGVVGSGASAGPTRNCITWPVVSGSATRKSTPGHAAAEGLIRADIAEDVVAHRHVGEVHDDIGAFGRAHEQLATIQRPSC